MALGFAAIVLSACRPGEAVLATETAKVATLDDAEYPENPNRLDRSAHWGEYTHGRVTLSRRLDGRVDVTLAKGGPNASDITLPGIDLGLLVPHVPAWLDDGDRYLQRVSLRSQEFTRQQLRFDRSDGLVVPSPGPEAAVLTRVDIGNNRLAAGKWEITLFADHEGDSEPYWQGWFDVPSDLYADLFNARNEDDWSQDESMLSGRHPLESKPIVFEDLRDVIEERTVAVSSLDDRPPPMVGERLRKEHLVLQPVGVKNLLEYRTDATTFASFVAPGVFRESQGRAVQLGALETLVSGAFREVMSPAEPDSVLHEVELTFRGHDGKTTRLVIGGVDLADEVPRQPFGRHGQGFQMPVGVGTLSFHQPYAEAVLRDRANPWYCLLVDGEGNRVEPAQLGFDGPLLYWDWNEPDRLHVMLLAGERSAIVGHFAVDIPVVRAQPPRQALAQGE